MSTVTKRNGSVQPFDAAKLTKRIEALSTGLNTSEQGAVDIAAIVETVNQGCTEGILTSKLDDLVAQAAAYSVTKHPDYGLLGGRVAVSALHKVTSASIKDVATMLYDHQSVWNDGQKAPIISDIVKEVVDAHHEELQAMIDWKYDFNYEFFGFKTLEKSYLLRKEIKDKETGGLSLPIVERPQMMLMRVSIAIHNHNMERVKETYLMLAQGLFTHATPTLFNAGTPKQQMSSCFLLAMKEDSLDGVYDTLKECARISKQAGGIGVHVHCIRSTGSHIDGTNGTATGLIPMLRVFNNTARYVDQGGGRRKGAFAVYLEPWHADIHDFLQLKKNTGVEENRARDLFYALWIPDLFMKRCSAEAEWTLFDPRTAPGLADCHGEEFELLYTRYEKEGRGIKTIKAQDLWFTILEAQMETGTPYMLYKDSCNSKSNQKNLGTIKCSNLCTEIIEYTSKEETAVCNLASIALPKFVDLEKAEFDHVRLREVTQVITRNLNRVIDENFYPSEEGRFSNMKHRPIGIGVQGLADAFCMLRLPFASEAAKKLNEEIFETIYFSALEESVALAEKDGHYSSFPGSPASEGILQFDMWKNQPGPSSGRWDWDALKAKVKKTGMRNSLLLAPMPTASTSQILGNNECFEPFTSNIYLRRVLSGEFPVVNKFLVVDLLKRGLWTDDVRNLIIAHNGSVQKIDEIPQDLKDLYKVVWEIKQKDLIDMAAHRGKYIDQSQSLNLFLESPTTRQLTAMHFYAWKQGLKTGMYYLRSRPAVDAIKFTVDQAKIKAAEVTKAVAAASGSGNGTTDCVSCGS